MIQIVTEKTLYQAAVIHARSWQESHRAFCSPEFVALHTTEHQTKYLKNEIYLGKIVYILTDEIPVTIVSLKDDLIENFYVLPEMQRKGYGSSLLQFVMKHCSSAPSLWVLSNNQAAIAFYKKHGFAFSGKEKHLSATLSELEMKKQL